MAEKPLQEHRMLEQSDIVLFTKIKHLSAMEQHDLPLVLFFRLSLSLCLKVVQRRQQALARSVDGLANLRDEHRVEVPNLQILSVLTLTLHTKLVRLARMFLFRLSRIHGR